MTVEIKVAAQPNQYSPLQQPGYFQTALDTSLWACAFRICHIRILGTDAPDGMLQTYIRPGFFLERT